MAKKTLAVVEIEEEIEGEYAGTADLLFYRIGASVSLTPSGCAFDIEEAPKQPLAVSERFGVLFIAHSEGFLVVSTKDVIRLAKDTKETVDEETKKGLKEKRKRPSVKESSILDIPMGKISILALSADSSILAASNGDGVHLFSVPSLLRKKQASFVSSFFGKFGNVKDLKWCTSHDNTYIALSSSGALLRGDLDGNLQEIMDNVDAVDWSVDGSSLVVARNETLSILSCQFDEQIQLPLLLSWTSDDPETHIKVDSIKWLQNGRIIIGCMQVKNNNDVGGYFIQVINSGEDDFKESSKPVAVSFIDFFHAIGDNFMSLEWGPHLFASFLDRWRIAVLANRKNMDDHVMLLEFPDEKESKNVMGLELEEEKFTPRIELQENRDENLILALGVDKVSMYEQLEFVDGEDVKNLSPYCILLCLTIEGKVVLFHVTRKSDPSSALVQPSFEVPEEVASTENRSMSAVSSSSQPLASVMKLANGEQPRAWQTVDEETSSSLLAAMPAGASSVPEQLSGSPYKQGFNMPFSHSQPSQSFVMNSVENIDVATSPSQNNSHVVGTEITGLNANSNKFTDVGTGLIGQKSLVDASLRPKSPNLNFILPNRDVLYSSTVSSTSNSGIAQRIEIPRLLSDSLSSAANIASSLTLNTKGTGMHPSNVRGLKTGAVTGGGKCLPSTADDNSFLGNPVSTTRPLISSDYRPLKSSGMPELNLSEHLHSVNDMMKELDNLLLDIEEDGKFGDACISSLRDSVLTLEKGLEDLLQKSMASKASIGEVATKVQHLQDMMVQISAREGYMKGIVKQASNSQYWDIWNRQKLGPDFELKQEQILKANQSLRNQLVELERHFNIIEFNKFGGSSGTFRHRCSLSASEASRRIQNVHRLHNTVTSQLSAAEHLSDCLSKQMSVLNIASPPVKQQSTAKELLESIGVHQDSFESPDMKKATLPFASSTKGILFSASSRSKDGRNKASECKGYEPETARRRRDSLDRSLVRFEPQKTTVKRTIQQANHKVAPGESNRAWSLERFSSEEKNKEQNKLSSLQHHADNSQFRTTPFQKNLGHEGNLVQQAPGLMLGDAYKCSRELSQYMESGTSRFSQIQKSPVFPSAVTSTARFNSTSNTTHGNDRFSEKLASQSDRRVDHPGSYVSAVSENNKIMHNVLNEVPVSIATSSLILSHSPPVKRPPLENSERKGQPNKPDYTTGQNILASSPVASLNVGKVTGLSAGIKASSFPMDGKFGVSQPVETSVVCQSSASLSAFSQLKPSGSSPVPLFSSTVAAKASSSSSTVSTRDMQDTIQFGNDGKQIPSVATMTSASSAAFHTLPPPSSSPFQFESTQLSSSFSTLRAPLTQTSPMLSSSLVSVSQSLPSSSPLQSTDSQSSTSFSSSASAFLVEKPLSSTSSVPTSHSLSSASALVLQLKDSQSSPSCTSNATISQPPPLSSTPASSASMVIPSPNSTVKSMNELTAKSQNDLPGAMSHIFTPTSMTMPSNSPSMISSSPLAKSEGLDLADTPEDDMEEEAPESTSTLDLGSLGGFGLGLSSASSAQKSSPFGGSFVPAVSSPASSPFSVSTPPGQLFKPASFSLPSAQQTQASSPVNPAGGSGGFRGFGQPSQIGSGQQALQSVLGAFGQSHQFGNSSLPGGLPSGGFGSRAGSISTAPKVGGGFSGAAAGGGFAALASGTGGFASAASGGGFASLASGTGGFANASTGGFAALSAGTLGFATAAGGGGFATLASVGGSAGGFAAAATGTGFPGAASGSAPSGGGGFGAAGSGGFGGGAGSTGAGGKPPPQLLMQMRK